MLAGMADSRTVTRAAVMKSLVTENRAMCDPVCVSSFLHVVRWCSVYH